MCVCNRVPLFSCLLRSICRNGSIWILLYRVKHPEALEIADGVFTEEDYPTVDRKEFFTNHAFEYDLERIIAEKFSCLVESLTNIRQMLHFSYVDESLSGDGVVFNPASYSDIYAIVWVGFKRF